ncbi:Transcription factor [Akanthomyces lecanii RCEF 1005]|uniref:Transcription factor n=1 Tax=Akanthomyces lecanii RCEF 1005 TaxID=1081108 RepID=A0A168GZH8_CORDF|nr:Transcription factor [Akanthomyces lecanii RCEF 1005]
MSDPFVEEHANDNSSSHSSSAPTAASAAKTSSATATAGAATTTACNPNPVPSLTGGSTSSVSTWCHLDLGMEGANDGTDFLLLDSLMNSSSTSEFGRFSIPMQRHNQKHNLDPLQSQDNSQGLDFTFDCASSSSSSLPSILPSSHSAPSASHSLSNNAFAGDPFSQAQCGRFQFNKPDTQMTLASYSPSLHQAWRPTPLRGVFAYNRFFGQSHYLNSVYQFPDIYRHIFQLEQDRSGTAYAKLALCKELAKPGQEDEVVGNASSNLASLAPPQHIAEKLVHAYLRTFESVFRILHVPTFLEDCSDYFANPEFATDEFLVTLLLVGAIGIGFCPELTLWSARPWIHAAQAWLTPFIQQSGNGISAIQVSCLLLLAKQTNDLGSQDIDVQVGAVLHLAVQTGLHIDPLLLPGTNFYDQEMRRRLWATVLELKLQSAMDSGDMPMLSMEDTGCTPPLNLRDESFNEDTQTPPIPEPLEVFTRCSVQIALVSSFSLRLKIAKAVNNVHRECPYDCVKDLTSRFTSFYQSYIAKLQSRTVSGHVLATFNFSMRLLELLVLRFLAALHQPYTIKTKNDPTLYFSRKVVLEASLSLLARISTSNRDIPGEIDYSRLAATGSGMFFNATSQAAIAVCEDLIGQLEESGLPITSAFSSVSKSKLLSVIHDFQALLTLRLRTNESSVRGYLLFAGLVAKANALESRRNVQQAISNALNDGLDHCCQILKMRSAKDCTSTQRSASCDSSQRDDYFLTLQGFTVETADPAHTPTSA